MSDHQSLFKSPEGRAKYMAAYDAVLALWPVRYENLDLEGKFGCSHIIAAGPPNAPPLILLHAANTSSTIWFPNIRELSEHYRTYAIDILGNAGKSISTRPMPTQADCAEWLVQVFDALQIERAHVVGLSYGGWIALNLALQGPQRVSKAVLISPASPFVPFNNGFILRLLPSMFLPFDPVIAFGMQALFAKGFKVRPEFMRQLVTAGKYCRLQNEAAPFPKVLSDDELGRVETPLLLLLGEQEVCFEPKAAFSRAKSLIPNLQAELIPGVGHALTMERPDLANARILGFLGGAAD